MIGRPQTKDNDITYYDNNMKFIYLFNQSISVVLSKPVAQCNIVAISNWHLFLLAKLVISPFSAYRNCTFSCCSDLVVVVVVAVVTTVRVFCIAGLLTVV